MKFGVADYGMNVWYGGCYDIEKRLLDLKALGFDGIERVEAIDAADALNRASLYRKCGMDFATCRGPKVEYNIKWTAGLGKEYIWLDKPTTRETDFDTYCRQANELAEVCKRFGLKCLLHNHMGQRIETQEELDTFMTRCPGMYLLLDVGHLHAAGGDITGTISRYADRLVAVHFKDVFFKDKENPDWKQRLRFTELGSGNSGMDFPAIGAALKKCGFDGWVFIEQDTHNVDALAELKHSLEIMKQILK